MKQQDREKQEARERLLAWVKPGDTVYTILRHVSRSGMQHEIGVVLLADASDRIGKLVDLHPNHAIGVLLGLRQGKRDGVIVGGCGMDMGFHLVYNLGSALWPKGFDCVGSHCPSNDHSNGDRDYTPHHHTDGGYALSHRWL